MRRNFRRWAYSRELFVHFRHSDLTDRIGISVRSLNLMVRRIVRVSLLVHHPRGGEWHGWATFGLVWPKKRRFAEFWQWGGESVWDWRERVLWEFCGVWARVGAGQKGRGGVSCWRCRCWGRNLVTGVTSKSGRGGATSTLAKCFIWDTGTPWWGNVSKKYQNKCISLVILQLTFNIFYP